MKIFTQPPTAKGPAETFTGDVWVDLIHAGPELSRSRPSVVRFAPCSRSHWHSHRLGQTLHILEGTALIGSRDGTVIEVHPGDTVYTAPGDEHWHGAAPDRFMAHLVLMEGDDSDAPQTIWGGKVTDADYAAPPPHQHPLNTRRMEDLLMSTTADQNTGRVAVITGASSGIGEATARALAARGYRLALLARRADRIKALADELGNGAIAIQADVTDRDSIVKAAERVKIELGGTDVLVNNAGIMLLAPFTEEGHDDHRRMIEANLLGAITVTEVFLDQLRGGGGDLVNLSSVAGRTARPGNAVYAATKWGINGWSESLRQELQPGVRVMVIEPGAVATELTDHITNADVKQMAEQMYQQLAITADDIAEVIAFAVTRPRRMTLNEILVRPTAQP